jgi:uncharacterized membrane protein
VSIKVCAKRGTGKFGYLSPKCVFSLFVGATIMLRALLIAVHVLSAVIWVGGMFLMHSSLRPAAAALLEPPVRLPLLCGVMKGFFVWVKAAITLLFVTGIWMISLNGSFFDSGMHVHLMVLIAVIMTIIFGIIYAGSFKQLKAAAAAKEWPQASQAMVNVRQLILVNLVLGMVTVAIGAGGRHLVTSE